MRDHFFAQVKQCSPMWPWVHEYERAQPSRASPEAGNQYSYQHLAVGVRFLIEKRNDERNKRLMQKLPNNERKQEHGKPDRRAAPGSEQDYRKEERPKAKAKSQKPVKACAAYTKGQCKKGQSCLEYHDDKARENRERNLALAAAQRREKREQADKNKERGRRQTPGPSKPSKQKCWAYAEGKCSHQNCRFIHEALNADEKKAKEQW